MAGRHDPAKRRRAHRRGRERGCHVYIAADELVALGIDPLGPTPFYRAWPGPKRKHPTILVQFYAEP